MVLPGKVWRLGCCVSGQKYLLGWDGMIGEVSRKRDKEKYQPEGLNEPGVASLEGLVGSTPRGGVMESWPQTSHSCH